MRNEEATNETSDDTVWSVNSEKDIGSQEINLTVH